MSRRLLSLFILVTLGMTPRGWGTEPEVTQIIRFGNPADAARISVANARISKATGTPSMPAAAPLGSILSWPIGRSW